MTDLAIAEARIRELETEVRNLRSWLTGRNEVLPNWPPSYTAPHSRAVLQKVLQESQDGKKRGIDEPVADHSGTQ